ncbi:hypothetical protein [Marinimicrobium sp. C2-29]|uniref:hypothetical protein n=1 Tax=Marinimicrobium sp. C2-29 TaxID=3139825 RepID=UPI00313A2554
MGADVEHKFEGGFLLDEVKLRKIVDLIESRTGRSTVEFKVHRGDSYSYVTSNADDVADEDNDDWRAITKLQISITEDSPKFFMLTFSEKGISLHISGEDRDSVYLIFSDLRGYINNEVLTKFPFTDHAWWVLSRVLFVGSFLAVTYFVFDDQINKNPSHAIKALESNDISAKLNYLISEKMDQMVSAASIYWIIPVMLIPIFFGSNISKKMWHLIFPTNEFLFGKRKVIYEKRRSFMEKIFWGVIVAAVVTGVVGFFVTKLAV